MKKGFTLIELLIAISLIGIFSTFLVVNFSASSAEREIKNEALKVIDGIKRAQTMALAGDSVNSQSPASYIFRLENCSLGCNSFKVGGDVSGVLQQTYEATLSKAVMKIDGGYANLDIYFSPPRADILFNIGTGNEAVIRVENIDDPDINRCIAVNKISGRIDLTECL